MIPTQDPNQELPEDDMSHMPVTYQILSGMYKSKHIQEILIAARTQMILDRAYERLDFSEGKLMQAAAAHAASAGALELIGRLINLGHVIEE